MEIPTHAQLLERIEAFCGRHELAETRLCRQAGVEPGFVARIRAGENVTLGSLNKLASHMAEQDRLLEAGDSVSEAEASPGKEWPITGEAADDAAIEEAA